MKKTGTLFLSVLLFAAVAFAHGGEEHLMGTVTKITDKAITVEMKDKKTAEAVLKPETKCMKGDATAELKEVKVGDRVAITAKKSGDKLVATMVRIGAAPAAAHKH